MSATPAMAAHAWSNYHWARTANPFAVNLGDNVDATWDAYLATASADWTNSAVMDTPIVPGATTGRKCAATRGRVEVCNAAYGRNGWLGLASISLSGGHIVQGTAKMNDTYFATSTYNNPNERLHVMCQEVGHDFGLSHTSEDGSSQNTCMDYFSNTGANATSTASTHPNQHDYDQLASMYAHLDATNTIQSAQSTDPNAKPYKTERHDSRRESTIVETFADDSKRITHITWTT